jgi:chromosome partitioning protein
MGKVVTVMNMKGGVGKTTVTAHLAGAIASYSIPGRGGVKKVLMIDYDPQFNLSQAFLPPTQYFHLEEARKTTLAILTDDEGDLDPYVLQVPGNHVPPSVHKLRTSISEYENDGCLHIIPATLDLMYVALGQTTSQLAPMEERFAKFIAECRREYDLTVIDCHPAGSIFTKTALRNSDAVLIPVVDQRYAVRGIGLMLTFIDAKKRGTMGPVPHILFNRMPRTGVSDVETSIRRNPRFSRYCMLNTLKYYKALEDPEAGQGFVWQSKKPYSNEVARNLRAVAAEFLQKLL